MMKGTDHFKQVIEAYLIDRAECDTLFAKAFAKENKNLDDCVTYILNEVKRSGCNGFADEEIYSMAVHYYDEDELEVGEAIHGKVVVNHTMELTEEEKLQARKDAIRQLQQEELQKMRQPIKKKKSEPSKNEEGSLFDTLFSEES